jgi:hypothetical protein
LFLQGAPQLILKAAVFLTSLMRKEHRLAFAFFEGSTGPKVSVIAAVLFFLPAAGTKQEKKGCLE